jgi:hypothetical protein
MTVFTPSVVISGMTLNDISSRAIWSDDPSAYVTVAVALPQKSSLPNSTNAGAPVTAMETGLTSSTAVILEGNRYAFFIWKWLPSPIKKAVISAVAETGCS